MADTLTIFGNTYANVEGIIATDNNGNDVTFTKGGGGASNVVQGTFTTSSTTGAASTLTIPYTGSGYPIFFALWIKGGIYNNSSSGNTDWYNLVKQYAIGYFAICKARMTTAPTYGTSGADNYGSVTSIYKNSTSSATTYTRGFSVSANSFTSSNASASNTAGVRFKGNGKTVSYFVAASSYGLWADTEYEYIAVYSS